MRGLERGSVWLADLNPPRGREPGKVRPVLVVQSQALLDAEHPSTLIVPMTTRLVEDAAPLRLRISAQGKLKKNSDLLFDQLRAIDNLRIVEGPLLQCSAAFMAKVDDALHEVLDLLVARQ